MKKSRFLSTVAVVAMLFISLSVSTPVYATSRTTTGEVLGGARTEDAAAVLGERRNAELGVGITVGDITDATVLNSLSDLELFAQLITAYTGKAVTASELSVLDKMEITHDANTVVSKSNPLFIPFSFPSILANSEVYTFHYGKNGWEIVPGTVSSGKIIGQFTDLSPVAIVAKTSTLKGSVLGAGRSVSARTGDYRMLYVAVSVAILAVAGLIYKKKAI